MLHDGFFTGERTQERREVCDLFTGQLRAELGDGHHRNGLFEIPDRA